MARLFDGDEDWLTIASGPAIDTSSTIAFWANLNAPSESYSYIIDIETGRLILSMVSSKFQFYDGAFKDYGEGIAYAGYLGAWHHYTWTFNADTTTATLYIDGASVGTNATYVPTSISDVVRFGYRYNGGSDSDLSGSLAEVAFWNIATLTVEEIVSLAKGFSPQFVRPQSLVSYWPLIRGLNDKKGGYNLTANGTTVTSHCRIILPK